MNNRKTQQQELAGKTKLTAVTIGHGTHKCQFFAWLVHDERGAAKLPQAVLDRFLNEAGVRRGDTYTVA